MGPDGRLESLRPCRPNVKTVREALKETAEKRNASFEEAATLLGTSPHQIEKDLWICAALDTLFHHMDTSHPRMVFKGGTSLSKAYSAISRMSEDIDIAFAHEDFGFTGSDDPTDPDNPIDPETRKQLRVELKETMRAHLHGAFRANLERALPDGASLVTRNRKGEKTGAYLGFAYPSLYADANDPPVIKLDFNATSPTTPAQEMAVTPYVSTALRLHHAPVSIPTMRPEKTFWDKVMVLCDITERYNDTDPASPFKRKLPRRAGRHPARHYYDLAMLCGHPRIQDALAHPETLLKMRRYARIIGWKQYTYAEPGALRIVPPGPPPLHEDQPSLREFISDDYKAMQDFFIGAQPEFDWVVEHLQHIEDTVNAPGKEQRKSRKRSGNDLSRS